MWTFCRASPALDINLVSLPPQNEKWGHKLGNQIMEETLTINFTPKIIKKRKKGCPEIVRFFKIISFPKRSNVIFEEKLMSHINVFCYNRKPLLESQNTI